MWHPSLHILKVKRHFVKKKRASRPLKVTGRCWKIGTSNHCIDTVVHQSGSCPHQVQTFEMPAYLPSNLPKTLFSAYSNQRKPITQRVESLSQKLFQGIHDLGTGAALCQHIPFIQDISEYCPSKFHSISLETFKSGDTAKIAPCRMMFIASGRFSVYNP